MPSCLLKAPNVSERLSFTNLITSQLHLSYVSFTFSAMFTSSHHLISSFHAASDRLSFITFHYTSIVPFHVVSFNFLAILIITYLLISSFVDIPHRALLCVFSFALPTTRAKIIAPFILKLRFL